MTIPLALFDGLLHVPAGAQGRIKEATDHRRRRAAARGRFSARTSRNRLSGQWFVLSQHQVTIAMALYTIAASVLPVWMLLTPRAYLSTFMKIGTIAFLVDRRDDRQPEAAGAGVLAVRRRRRPDRSAARSSRSCSSPSRAARSPGSTR